MKNKLKSTLYVPILACLLATGGVAIWNLKTDSAKKNPEQIYYLDEYFAEAKSTEKESEAHVVDKKDALIESLPKFLEKPKAEFVLRIVDEYVVVYRVGEESEEDFMATGICAEDLPTDTLEEIQKGKEITNEEELYFFLESHSS